MRAITYKNTRTNIPNWVNDLHERYSRGYAYETTTHFVHIYGHDRYYYTISIGLTAIQEKSGSLEDWVIATFGAENIEELDLEVGHSIQCVWRPSLYDYDDTYQALQVTEVSMRLSENSLRILLEKLDDIFQFIEPNVASLNTYSHRTRELLILACTEVENFWKYYLTIASAPPSNGRNYNTNDYVKIHAKLYLEEYEFNLKTYAALPSFRPFLGWNPNNPTVSLPWYDAYNKTKHDRDTHFNQATLLNCISSVVANLIMHSVKFSPFMMFEQSNIFSSLVNQHFIGGLINSNTRSYYIQNIILPTGVRPDLFIFDPKKQGYTSPFIIDPLVL